MSAVSAKAIVFKQDVVSDGADTPVPFVRHGISREVIDVRSKIFLTLEVRPGASGCDVTVNGYQSNDRAGVVDVVLVKTTIASDETILAAVDIKYVDWIEVKEDGTATETQTFILTAK